LGQLSLQSEDIPSNRLVFGRETLDPLSHGSELSYRRIHAFAQSGEILLGRCPTQNGIFVGVQFRIPLIQLRSLFCGNRFAASESIVDLLGLQVGSHGLYHLVCNPV